MSQPAPAPNPADHIPQRPRRDPALLAVVGVIVLLVVVALIVVSTRGTPARLAADTPGGVVQRYSTAVLAGDESSAARYLTAAALADCDRIGSSSLTDDIRVTLVDTTERPTSADVRVSIVTTYDSGPFGSSEYQSEEVFDLVRVHDGWLIEQAPWPLMVCPRTGTGDGL